MARAAFNGLKAPQELMVAATHGDITGMREALEKKHQRNAIDVPDVSGMNALLYALDNSQEAAAALLLHHGADADCHNNNGTTALMLACEKRLSGATEKLLKAEGIRLDAQEKDSGDTALLKALRENHPWAACRLLEAGANYDIANHKGETAEQLARRHLGPRDYTLFTDMLAQLRQSAADAAAAARRKERQTACTLQRDIKIAPVIQLRPRRPND